MRTGPFAVLLADHFAVGVVGIEAVGRAMLLNGEQGGSGAMVIHTRPVAVIPQTSNKVGLGGGVQLGAGGQARGWLDFDIGAHGNLHCRRPSVARR